MDSTMFCKRIAIVIVFVAAAWQVLAGTPLPGDSTKTIDPVLGLTRTIMPAGTRVFEKLVVPPVNTSLDPIVILPGGISDSTAYHRAKALEFQEEVTRKQAFVSSLTSVAGVQLPVGIANNFGDVSY